jgi:histidine triad (HIT) family protein
VADCVFCKIASKTIPSSIVYETADVVAFKDLTPRAPLHVLVIPRTHVAKLSEMEDEALGESFFRPRGRSRRMPNIPTTSGWS